MAEAAEGKETAAEAAAQLGAVQDGMEVEKTEEPDETEEADDEGSDDVEEEEHKNMNFKGNEDE